MILPFTWHGAQEAPVLVLGNSLGASAWSWHHQVTACADRFRVLTFELPGHFGEAEEQVPFTFDSLVDDTAALLEAEGVTHARYCGVSLGGAIGIALAARYPHLVSDLVVVNAPIRQPSRQFWLDRADAVEANGLAEIAASARHRWFAAPDADSADIAQAERILAGLPAGGYANACRALADLDVTEDCAKVTARTLVVSSSSDLAVDPDNSTEITSRVRGAQLHPVLDAGHMLPLEQPELLQPLLEHFFAAQTERSSTA